MRTVFFQLRPKAKTGFTLIELSIVLVIIGLIVGGVVVGQDLISAATIRAQVTQIEKYNAAINTFRGKYGYLPGDIPEPAATSYGFKTRGPSQGQGDGNGIIEGPTGSPAPGVGQESQETAMVWVDLSAAGLIDGGFTRAIATLDTGATADKTTTPSIDAYLPRAKVQNSYVYVWSGGDSNADNKNYFGISGGAIYLNANWIFSDVSLTVNQAASIDRKIDDGVPGLGRVTAIYLPNHFTGWSNGTMNGQWNNPATISQIGDNGTVCYHNDFVAGAVAHYATSHPATISCALSIQFQ